MRDAAWMMVSFRPSAPSTKSTAASCSHADESFFAHQKGIPFGEETVEPPGPVAMKVGCADQLMSMVSIRCEHHLMTLSKSEPM
jgi:hypothetical protein